jgi:hypothetical protein
MKFTFLRMIRGWFTATPLSRGRVGIRIPESGLEGRISHLDSASELVGLADLDGDGVIGDLTGITTTRFITTTDTIPEAERFITGTPSIEVASGAAEFITVREE